MKDKKRATILVVIGLVFLALSGYAASTANAKQVVSAIVNTIADNPSPTCSTGYWFNQKTGKCDVVPACKAGTVYNQKTNTCDAAPATVCTTTGSVTTCVSNPQATVGGKTVNSSSVASGEIVFAAEMHIKGVKVNSQNCFWTKSGQPWQNGYNTPNGVVFHTETTPAQLCHWHGKLVKVAGGETGRHCFNLAKLGPGPQNVTVLIVNSFNVTIPLKAQASIEIHDTCGQAAASATASGKMTLIKYIRSKGRVSMDVFESSIVNLKTAVQAGINCPPPATTTTTQTVTQPSTTVTQPGTTTAVPSTTTQTITTTTTTPTTTTAPQSHFTNVSCTGFEEIFGGESMIIKCDVSNDNGAPISLDAQSNNGNSRVSGINCYSQGGTPSCQGNGQFEFRVTGINGSGTVLSSSVTVTASSNGVSKTWNSDPFPVDP